MEDKKVQVQQNTAESFEERFARMSRERAAAREEKRRQKHSISGSSQAAFASEAAVEAVAVYRMKNAAAVLSYRPRREGAVKRTIRLVKGLKEAKVKADALPYCTAENRRQLYSEVFRDAWAPACNAVENAADTLWGFLSSLGYDILEIIVFIVNFFIKIGYVFGSACLFIWDKLWDLRLWFDIHKKAAFQIFAGVVSAVAMGLILVSSMSAYQYSYYGRVLGIAKSQQEVYDVIALLGDKLSENAGANVDLDVERDIQFEKIYGFGLNVGSHDEILNTLTYMKDIRVEAYALNIDGVQVAILDKEETALDIMEKAKENFLVPMDGYDIIESHITNDVFIQPTNTVLADISNPQVVEKYIVTGSTADIEPDKYQPMINVSATAIHTYTQQIAYGMKYVKNEDMFMGDIRLVTEGQYGILENKAEVRFENGVEVARVETSSEVIQNPVDAVYFQGTKDIPERSGTGTWIFPLKAGYVITSYFGPRSTGIAGASTYHEGIDLSVPVGTKIYAADGGVVTFAGWKSAEGYHVVINHGGLYETVYEHCSVLLVSIGDEVMQGQNIALVGRSGVASGPHLHFGVRYNGKAIDPLSLYTN